jgi:glycosyltransferase involved in cell wall biosynthesis
LIKSLSIAILGTRGIPNAYGGFEQCAERLSHLFVEKGHNVTVYNPSDHGYKNATLNGVNIVRSFSNEKKLKFLNVFIFDYICLKHALRQQFDIILELGYHPAALYYYLNKKGNHKIVTNMAGMEWWRSKWNYATRKLIKYCEKLAVHKSDAFISDNQGIKDYFIKQYGADSFCIAYGAELFDNPVERHLERYTVEKYSYDILIARFQKDNNIEMVLDGHILSGTETPLLVVGGNTSSYGVFLKEKYKSHHAIKFLGGIYNYEALSSLRWFSRLYFHGHSCGGTNPSLLEAMASNAYIIAYDNPFNRYVLEGGGLYFKDSRELSALVVSFNCNDRNKLIQKNRDRIRTEYNWEKIAIEYLKAFDTVLLKKK